MGINELESIVKTIPVEYLKHIKANNAQPCSERTIRFDVPTEDKDVTKRVKVTATPDGFTVKLYEIKETDQIDLISAGGLVKTIDAMIKGTLPEVDLTKYGKQE